MKHAVKVRVLRPVMVGAVRLSAGEVRAVSALDALVLVNAQRAEYVDAADAGKVVGLAVAENNAAVGRLTGRPAAPRMGGRDHY